MTQAEIIALLPPGRLPLGMMWLEITDFVCLFGVGLLIAAILAWLLTPFFAWKPSRRALIITTRHLPVQERILAICKILGHLPEDLRTSAYNTGPFLPEGEIERIALKARPVRK